MFRHLLRFLFFLILPTSLCFSQVANYTFSETTGTYTAIAGGTQLAVTTGGSLVHDQGGSNISLPTGSRFTFNGITITSLNMTDDGALWLNPNTTTRGFGIAGPISSTGVATGVIAGMGMDLTNTELSSQTYERRWQDDGTEVIFQWTNAARYLLSTSERFSFQIRINKTTGVIRIVYGNMTTIANSTTRQPQVGLRGSTNTDFNVRRLTTSVPDGTPNWGAPNGTAAGTSNGNTVRFTSSGSCFPNSGLIFIWTPPATCPQPSSLTISYTSPTSANLSWTEPLSPPSDGYEWEIRTSGAGGSGSTGLTASGSVGTGITTASTSSLAGSTTYTLYVRSNCGGTFSSWVASSSSTSPVPPPSNDACSNATSLPCATNALAGTTVGSVAETAPLGYSSQYGVWYTFTGDGLQTTISSFAFIDIELLIMTGSACSGFTLVSTTDDWGVISTETAPSFTSVLGQQYYVYIAHYSTSSTTTGSFSITRTCTTPCNTTASTIAVNLSNTVTNDVVTYTVTGGDGTVTGYQYSFDNFTTIAGTITTTNNPWSLLLNTTNSVVYVRAVTQNGTCNSTTSNIVSTTLRCATPYIYGTEYSDYITNVTFNTINNNSTRDVGSDGYQNFLSTSTDVCRGLPYTISVSSTNNGGYLGYQVWVDWNNDNDFDDVGESVFSSGPTATATGTITIPTTAILGSVKMRVLGVYNTTPNSNPCDVTFYDYGEIEEYTLNIGTFTLTTPLVGTDMIFVGRTSTAFNTTSNWLQYNGTSYDIANSTPSANTNIIIPSNQTCASRPLTIAANSIAEAKTVTIEPNGELRLNGTLSVFKDFNNYGLVTNTNNTSQRMLEFVGSGAQDHLIMQGNNTLYNLRINKPSGEVQLENDINITNNLDIPSGDLRLNLKIVDLGTTGFLSNEGDGHSAYCDCPVAYIQHTINIGPNVTVTPGNMGLEITTNGNQMGNTIVRRRHKRAGSNGASFLTSTTPSVFRIYEVIPEFNGTNYPPNGLNVDITYTYLSHEVGAEIANEEALFTIWRSGDNGITWEDKGGTVDLNNHTVSITGFQQFSWITTGPGGESMPINLLSFDGINKGEYNNLNWVTDNEINFSHFVLEKSRDGFNFEPLTEIPSNGLNTRSNYTSNDYNPHQLTYYRLKSIDLDGSYEYSNVVVIERKGDINTGILYPNPTNDIINYGFTSEENEILEIKVLDMVGRVVIRNEVGLNVGNNRIPINLTELISGNYTIVIKHTNSGVTKTSKVIKI